MKFKKSSIGSAVAFAIGGVALISPSLVAAQDSQRVEVTGSRILSVGAQSPSPLQVLTADDIAKSGATNIQELLLKNPTLGTPAISRTNSNFSTSSAGVSTVDLRNLGSDRTLVLINGRRVVAGIPGSSAVDLNTIPTDFIERVEILTGGASALYGSDAVAGVVNFILKKNFQGLTLDASLGQSEKSDDKKQKFGITFGANGADGKANLMAHFGYSNQGAVYSNRREGGETDSVATALLTGDWHDMFGITTPFYSSFAPQGRFFPNAGTAGSRTFNAAGNLIAFSTNGPAGDGVGATGFNRQEFRTIAIPTERFLFATKGEYEFAPNHTAFIEGTYAATSTRTRLEPFPLDIANIYPKTGRAPAEFLVNGVKVRNPLIPAALSALIVNDVDGDGLADYGFTRRLAEVGNRGNVADRDTFRIVSGVKGAIGNWDYDAYLGYGATKESQTSSGQVNVLNFRNALEAIPDTADVNGNLNTTEAVCRDADARAQGCVPINIFGFNTVSAAALNYVAAPGMLSTFTTQKMMGATVRGDIAKLPAGNVGIAAGVEYREEYSRSEFDPLQQAGLNAGNAIPRTEGKFDVKELFVEARIPLLKDAAFAKSLAATAAVRGSEYSTIGSTLSWTTGLEWSPASDFRFRMTRARATRAPNINELYSPPSQTFPTGLSDPCDGITATTTGTVADRCRAAVGVQSNMAANGGVFTLSQADLQGISGFDLGNSRLQEEKGDTFTLGLVVEPRSIPVLRNFSFTADYFKVKISDAIIATPRQFILDQCYGGDASFCQFITRRQAPIGASSAGSIDLINSISRNSGGLYTEGVDFTVAYADRVGPGRLSSRLAWTYLKEAYTVPLPGSSRDYSAGEIGEAKNKASLQVGYSWGPYSISTMTTYIAASALDDQFLAGFNIDPNDSKSPTLPRGFLKVPAKTYLDLQLGYSFGKSSVYLGIDNVFNTKSRLDGNLPGGVTGAPTASDVYDAIGRRYYVGLRVSM